MNRRSLRRARGLTLVEVLVATALLGMLTGAAVVGLQSVRERARGVQCMNNLREIGHAITGYQMAKKRFPYGCVEYRPFDKTYRHLGWSAFVLPYLEQQNLYRQLDLGKAYDSAENAVAARTVINLFLCPSSSRMQLQPEGRGASDYNGVVGQNINVPSGSLNGVLIYDKKKDYKGNVTVIPPIRPEHVRDGLGYTLMVSEDYAYDKGQWISGSNLNEQRLAIGAAPITENDIRSNHPGGAYGLFCDGHVRFLDETMDLSILAAICTRAGNESIDFQQLRDSE